MARSKSHPGSLEKRGKGFRVWLWSGGRYHRYTIQTKDRREAAQFARQKAAELERLVSRRLAGLPGPVRTSDLLTHFESEELPVVSAGTQRSYKDSLKFIRSYFVEGQGDPTLDQIHAAHIKGYLSWRRVHRAAVKGPAARGPLHNRTIAKDRAVLHRLFAIAEKLEWREGNPVARTDPPKGDSRTAVILTDEEYERLLGACSDAMLRLYVLVLGETGARCNSEALWLRWEDVDLEGGFIHIRSGRDGHRTKSGRSRYVPMTRRLVEAMREHFASFRFAAYRGVRSPWVFHHTLSRRHHKAGDRMQTLREGFIAAAAKAKLPAGLHQHDLRHRRVTTWLAAGKNAVHVKEAVGHSDLRTTMAYTHLSREHLRSLVESDSTRESPTPSRAQVVSGQ